MNISLTPQCHDPLQYNKLLETKYICNLVYYGRLSKSKSRTQTLRRRSWKLWFWHYFGFNVEAFFWLKKL